MAFGVISNSGWTLAHMAYILCHRYMNNSLLHVNLSSEHSEKKDEKRNRDLEFGGKQAHWEPWNLRGLIGFNLEN